MRDDIHSPAIIPVLIADWMQWEDKLAWHLQSIADRHYASLGCTQSKEALLDKLKDAMRNSREYQRWIVADKTGHIYAFALTTIELDAENTCHFHACVGEKRELWYKMLVDNVKVWAYSVANSRRMTAWGRHGWKKDLATLGFSVIKKDKHHTLYESRI